MQTKKTVKNPSRLKTPSRASEPAQVHDLVGAAMLILPKELKGLLGEQKLQSNAQELQSQEVLVIVREPGVVAYVHLPIVAMEMDGQALDLAGKGTKLRPITGAFSRRLRRQIRPYDMVSVVKPAAKAGRRV